MHLTWGVVVPSAMIEMILLHTYIHAVSVNDSLQYGTPSRQVAHLLSGNVIDTLVKDKLQKKTLQLLLG